MILLTYLPVDKSSFYAPMYSATMEGDEYIPDYETNSTKPPKGWWKKELDRKRGRNRPRDTMSLEQFMGEMNQR